MAEDNIKALQWPQFVAALIANIGALSVGTLFGWMSPATPRLMANETGILMDDYQLSWVAGAMPLGAAFTPLFVPFLIDSIGRKNTLLSVVAPLVAGFFILAWAKSPGMYYAGRFICGISGGAFSIVTPVYTAEIGDKSIRGALGTCYESLLGLGLEVSFVIGGLVSLFWLCAILGIIPIIFAVLFAFVPESPYYYMAKGNKNEAIKSLKWLRGSHYDVTQELNEIAESVNAREELQWADFRTPEAKKSIYIGLGLMVFQQITGVAAITCNATKIFQLSGSDIEPNIATMIVGLTFIFNFVSTMLVDRLGRRALLITSSLFLSSCTLALAIFFFILNDEQDVESIRWIPLAAMSIFMIMFAVGWGPIAWMMLGEIFPTKIKGICSSLACCVNWLTAFFVAKFFPELTLIYGEGCTFCGFSIIAAIGAIFVYTSVPETKGKSLDEIQKGFSKCIEVQSVNYGTMGIGKERSLNMLAGQDNKGFI